MHAYLHANWFTSFFTEIFHIQVYHYCYFMELLKKQNKKKPTIPMHDTCIFCPVLLIKCHWKLKRLKITPSLTLRPIKQCIDGPRWRNNLTAKGKKIANQHKISIYQNLRTVITAAWIIRLSIYKSLIFIFCERFYIKIWKLIFGSKISVAVDIAWSWGPV